jgi:hypothetical protein
MRKHSRIRSHRQLKQNSIVRKSLRRLHGRRRFFYWAMEEAGNYVPAGWIT